MIQICIYETVNDGNSSTRFSGHHQSFFLISNFPVESLKAKKASKIDH